MARKTRKTNKKPTRKSQRKPRKAPVPPPATAAKKRIRRSTKTTQVTGPEIDEALENLVNKTPLERKIDEKVTTDEQNHPKLLLSTNYPELGPFEPDEDIDDELENRRKMYEVPPKPRSPEGGNSSNNDAGESTESMTAADKAYEFYFN